MMAPFQISFQKKGKKAFYLKSFCIFASANPLWSAKTLLDKN